MAKHTLKILRGKYRKIFKVCLTILQHYARRVNADTNLRKLKVTMVIAG